MHTCVHAQSQAALSLCHVGRMETVKSRTGEEDHNVAAEHLHPLELRILGLHGSIIHLICCACGIRRAAHWLIEVFPATFSDPQSRASVWPNSSPPTVPLASWAAGVEREGQGSQRAKIGRFLVVLSAAGLTVGGCWCVRGRQRLPAGWWACCHLAVRGRFTTLPSPVMNCQPTAAPSEQFNYSELGLHANLPPSHPALKACRMSSSAQMTCIRTS